MLSQPHPAQSVLSIETESPENLCRHRRG
jgi:hypothetical protein